MDDQGLTETTTSHPTVKPAGVSGWWSPIKNGGPRHQSASLAIGHSKERHPGRRADPLGAVRRHPETWLVQRGLLRCQKPSSARGGVKKGPAPLGKARPGRRGCVWRGGKSPSVRHPEAGAALPRDRGQRPARRWGHGLLGLVGEISVTFGPRFSADLARRKTKGNRRRQPVWSRHEGHATGLPQRTDSFLQPIEFPQCGRGDRDRLVAAVIHGRLGNVRPGVNHNVRAFLEHKARERRRPRDAHRGVGARGG